MKMKAMNGTEFEVDPAEIKRHAMAMGMKPDNHDMMTAESDYCKRAKHNIAGLINYEHEIEDEEDAKEILAHCLNLSPKQADLLYEVMEFAIGMAN